MKYKKSLNKTQIREIAQSISNPKVVYSRVTRVTKVINFSKYKLNKLERNKIQNKIIK